MYAARVIMTTFQPQYGADSTWHIDARILINPPTWNEGRVGY